MGTGGDEREGTGAGRGPVYGLDALDGLSGFDSADDLDGLGGLDDRPFGRLEQAAAAAGTPRQPGDAPADLVVRLLAAHQVSAAVLYPLADVYRLARYATHTVDSTMRDQARAALGQLRAELTVSRSGPLADVP